MPGERHVVVTGVGLVTALGIDARTTWDGLRAGRSAIAKVEGFATTGDKVSVAAQVKADLAARLPPDVRQRTERFVHFATAAAREALADAGEPHKQNDRFGVVAGVGIGLPHPSEGYEVGPTSIIKAMPNAAPAWISILEGLRGPSMSVSTACASGAHAIGSALDHIRVGRADGMVAGGVDTVITRDVLRAYSWMRALNTARDEEPATMSRPFDATRRGFVLGEGAGFLVLEEREHARRRGANILAELRGFGSASDAYSIVAIAPEGEGMVRAMREALRDARLPGDAIDYISAHGTSTKMNDREETRAIHKVFGPQAGRMMVSSQKSMLGHCMGGAGAIEAVVTVLSLVHQTATPTINLRTPDPECDLDYVPNTARVAPIGAAMSNSFGFGGHDTALIFARPELS